MHHGKENEHRHKIIRKSEGAAPLLEQGRGGWAYMSMWRMRSEYLRRVREGMGRINQAM